MRIRIAVTAALALFGLPIPAAQAAAVPAGATGVRVTRIVNGDTIDVTTFAGKKLRVMLLESDAPERGRCWAAAAAKRTAALLPVGKLAYVMPDRKEKDSYGRWLFYVWNASGVHVNRDLVRYGYAKATLVKPNDRYIAVMRAEQARAKAKRLRIWSGKCDKTTTTTPNPTATPTPKPTPKATPTQSGTDPRYRTCGEANQHGYGPYRRGVDPEYSWYQDRDGDGLVCER